MTDILDLIDNAVAAWETSPDAMRWTPDPPPAGALDDVPTQPVRFDYDPGSYFTFGDDQRGIVMTVPAHVEFDGFDVTSFVRAMEVPSVTVLSADQCERIGGLRDAEITLTGYFDRAWLDEPVAGQGPDASAADLQLDTP